MKRLLTGAAMAALLLLAGAQAANAQALGILVQDNGVTIASTPFTAGGVANLSFSNSNWSLISITATGNPVQPGLDMGTISTNVTSSSTFSGSHTLTILATQVANDPLGAPSIDAFNSYQMQFLAGAANVSGGIMQNFIDAADLGFGSTQALTVAQLFSGTGNSFLNLPGSGLVNGLFSETMFAQFTVDAGGVNVQTNDQLVANAVPEPGTWAMMLLGFIGLNFMFRRRIIARAMA